MSSRFYTPTLAELYAKQGYLRKAAQIYGHLLQQEPHREDLRSALAKIEKQIEKRNGPTRKELAMLMREWVDLVKKQNQLKRK